MVIKIFAGIVLDGAHRVTGGFISGKGYVDQIFARKQIGEKARKKKHRVYVGFINLEKVYDKVNREALWQCLRMYDVGGNLLSGIKSMYVDSLACARVKGGKSELFMIDSGGETGVYHIPLAIQYIYGCSDEEDGDGKEWRLPSLLCANDLVLCSESEEDMRVMVGQFLEVYRKRGLKDNAGKSKEMVMNGEERLECEVCIDWIYL